MFPSPQIWDLSALPIKSKPDLCYSSLAMSRDFNLDGKVPPWGRNAAEYEAFFSLADVSDTARVIDCAGGPASFAAEWSKLGRFVVAVDPIYRQTGEEIAAGFDAIAERMLEGTRKACDRFIWNHYRSPEDLVERRRGSLQRFVTDYGDRKRSGRYVAAGLPELPFSAGSFDIVLCAHMLFLYSEEFSLEMHIASIREMLRVGSEVRIFPLLDMQGQRSQHLDATMNALSGAAHMELVRVPFEFRRGDCFMLRARKTDSEF
jgi:hypothetical protein